MWALILTTTGIHHYFHDAKVDLIDALACHSRYFASDFNAISYFGYIPATCSTPAVQRTPGCSGRG